MSNSNSITTSESHNFAPCSLRQPGDPLPFDFYYDHKQKSYFQPNSKQLNQIKSLYPGVTCAFIHGIILFVQTEVLPDYPPLTLGGLPVVFDLPFSWPGSPSSYGKLYPGGNGSFQLADPLYHLSHLKFDRCQWALLDGCYHRLQEYHPIVIATAFGAIVVVLHDEPPRTPYQPSKISSYRLPYVLGTRTVYYTSGVKALKEIPKSREFVGGSAFPGQLVHSNALGNEVRWCSVSTPNRKIPFLKIGSALVVPGDPRTKQAPQRSYNLLSFGGDISQEKLGGSPVVADGPKGGIVEAEVIGFC